MVLFGCGWELAVVLLGCWGLGWELAGVLARVLHWFCWCLAGVLLWFGLGLGWGLVF